MSEGFPGRYAGTCDDCGGPIVPGDRVGYNAAQELVHWDCPPEPPAVRPGEVACSGLFPDPPGGGNVTGSC